MFLLAVAADNAELRPIMLNKICKILQFLVTLCKFYARWPILRMLAKSAQTSVRSESQNSLDKCVLCRQLLPDGQITAAV